MAFNPVQNICKSLRVARDSAVAHKLHCTLGSVVYQRESDDEPLVVAVIFVANPFTNANGFGEKFWFEFAQRSMKNLLLAALLLNNIE